MLKAHGIPPAPDRPTSWRTFLRAHWGEIAGADFFTTEVWTPRGLITYYTLFVIDLRSRRVHVAGSTPTPDAWFMAQAARRLTDVVDGFLVGHQILICDRDRKWTHGFRHILQGAGVRIVLIPVRAPAPSAKLCGVGVKGRGRHLVRDWRTCRCHATVQGRLPQAPFRSEVLRTAVARALEANPCSQGGLSSQG